MHRIIALFCGIVLSMESLAAAPVTRAVQGATADPWITRTTKVAFEPRRAADAPVQLDSPKKDWMVLPSGGSVLIVLASRKGDAVVLVERTVLAQALERTDITDLFSQIEIEAIKEREPKAADFHSRVIDDGRRRLVAVEYGRSGVLGSERVRQYSMPMGKRLYRLTCISSASQFSTYDPVFSHIAASFTSTE